VGPEAWNIAKAPGAVLAGIPTKRPFERKSSAASTRRYGAREGIAGHALEEVVTWLAATNWFKGSSVQRSRGDRSCDHAFALRGLGRLGAGKQIREEGPQATRSRRGRRAWAV